jgi:hypothetical protein
VDAPVFFNGVDGATGGYLRPPVALADVARRLQGFRPDEETEAARFVPRRVRAGLDASDLAQAGWGVVFGHGTPPEVREALAPLLRQRREMAGERYREIEFRPGETKRRFLIRHNAGSGVVDPAKLPYYLLLVGDPESIPFEVQFHLGVQRAVGRLWLDTPDDYAAYARSLAGAEPGPPTGPPTAAFFAPAHPGDEMTRLSAEELVRPLAESFQQENPAWEVRTHLGDAATRDCLSGLLGGGATPSLLFTAGHGLGFTEGDDRQNPLQGALLCQEWPGPSAGWSQGLPESWYFAAEHVAPGASLDGMVFFCFACHSAGTPRESAFKLLSDGQPKPLASQAFVASLPRKLLARGAHAVIGHVDQSWDTSFVWSGAGAQRTVFESALWQIAAGGRVGDALGVFGERWAEIATDLGEALTDSEKAWLWLAHNDARGYVLLGDPAARKRCRFGGSVAETDASLVVFR